MDSWLYLFALKLAGSGYTRRLCARTGARQTLMARMPDSQDMRVPDELVCMYTIVIILYNEI